MAIIRNGKKLSNRQVKQFIMKVNNWTAEEYRKKYDIFKNKLRAYEAFEEYHTNKKVKKESAVEILYKEARAKATYKEQYKPSLKLQRIQSFTSVSSGKAGKKALMGERYQQRRTATYEATTSAQFQRLIEKNDKAREIAMRIKDPVKREKALADYANKIHAKMKEDGRRQENEAIPFGETFGSGDTLDFDIEAYF